MIEWSTQAVPANPANEDVRVSHEQLWQGLTWKAEYPTLFVSPITECKILDTFEDGFLREILHRTGDGAEWIQERVFLEPMNRVTFLRLTGSVLGRIVNTIEGDGDDLALRFRFTLALADRDADEKAYERDFAGGYTAAVEATLTALRGFVRSGEDPTRDLARARARPSGP